VKVTDSYERSRLLRCVKFFSGADQTRVPIVTTSEVIPFNGQMGSQLAGINKSKLVRFGKAEETIYLPEHVIF
jgi:hypothetical protein